MMLEPGDVVLVPFFQTDLDDGKRRPALVVSSRTFNEGPDVVACAVTSNLANSPFSVLLSPEDMAEGSLLRTSRVKAAKLAGLDKRLVLKRLGCVKPAVLRQVRKELQALLGLP